MSPKMNIQYTMFHWMARPHRKYRHFVPIERTPDDSSLIWVHHNFCMASWAHLHLEPKYALFIVHSIDRSDFFRVAMDNKEGTSETKKKKYSRVCVREFDRVSRDNVLSRSIDLTRSLQYTKNLQCFSIYVLLKNLYMCPWTLWFMDQLFCATIHNILV